MTRDVASDWRKLSTVRMGTLGPKSAAAASSEIALVGSNVGSSETRRTRVVSWYEVRFAEIIRKMRRPKWTVIATVRSTTAEETTTSKAMRYVGAARPVDFAVTEWKRVIRTPMIVMPTAMAATVADDCIS
jgi:hypothetical protein